MIVLFMMTELSCSAKNYTSESSYLYGEKRVSINHSAAGSTQPSGGQSVTGKAEKIPIVADHLCTDVDSIPLEWAEKAKKELHIAYGHTSHGSQITYGLLGMTYFKKDPFTYLKGAPEGSLDLRDNPFGGEMDLANPDTKTWAVKTREYLNKNKDINVVMWSWCGQLSKGDDAFVETYLNQMQTLEEDFPDVTFIYMTGHLDGTGKEGTLEKNNEKIRKFCLDNNKVLFDFADIESYNPDGVYFGDRYATDGCEYDSNGDKKPDKNWAIEWQNSHKKDTDWYDCYSAHSQPVNANMKASAMWWLLARLAGYNGVAETAVSEENEEYYALKLQSLNLFKGTDNGFALDQIPDRLQAAVMLTRLLGGEAEAKSKNYSHPFKDASWGSPYVGYLYHKKLTFGMSSTKFGSDVKVEASVYMTFLLRVLGYTDTGGKDFTVKTALNKGKELGIIDQDYLSKLQKEPFTRGDMVKLTYLSLKQNVKGKTFTLIEQLVSEKVVDKGTAEKVFKE